MLLINRGCRGVRMLLLPSHLIMALLRVVGPNRSRTRHEENLEGVDAVFKRLAFFCEVCISLFEVCYIFRCFGEDRSLFKSIMSVVCFYEDCSIVCRFLMGNQMERAIKSHLVQLLRSFQPA